MEIQLTEQELWDLCCAMNAAVLYYQDAKRDDAAAEARDLERLLSNAKAAQLTMKLEGFTELGRQDFKELIAKRNSKIEAAKRKYEGECNNVVELFPPTSGI